MNIETGELREQTEKQDLPWVPLQLGEIVDIKGCPCKLVYINLGRHRLTFEPVGQQGLRRLMYAKSRQKTTDKVAIAKQPPQEPGDK
jgi:hypothetical protein